MFKETGERPEYIKLAKLIKELAERSAMLIGTAASSIDSYSLRREKKEFMAHIGRVQSAAEKVYQVKRKLRRDFNVEETLKKKRWAETGKKIFSVGEGENGSNKKETD